MEQSEEETREDEEADVLKRHREAVVWFLQLQLERATALQSDMMERRLVREAEKSKSMLYASKGTGYAALGAVEARKGSVVNGAASGQGMAFAEDESVGAGPQLSADQMQVFAQENQDLLKLYESKSDQVR